MAAEVPAGQVADEDQAGQDDAESYKDRDQPPPAVFLVDRVLEQPDRGDDDDSPAEVLSPLSCAVLSRQSALAQIV